jgi:hypothetical protein
MNITVEGKSVYGEIKFYPMCDMSRGFAKIAGTKTLTVTVLRQIKAMGFLIGLANTDIGHKELFEEVA